MRRSELRNRRQLTDPMVLDVNDRGLLVDPRPYVARTRESTDFLCFIALPSALKQLGTNAESPSIFMEGLSDIIPAIT